MSNSDYIVNFRPMPGVLASDEELGQHAEWLAAFNPNAGIIGAREPPEGYGKYTTVDVLGPEFEWMNTTFSKQKFEWYLWFESIFLVPETMLPFLILRWS